MREIVRLLKGKELRTKLERGIRISSIMYKEDLMNLDKNNDIDDNDDDGRSNVSGNGNDNGVYAMFGKMEALTMRNPLRGAQEGNVRVNEEFFTTTSYQKRGLLKDLKFEFVCFLWLFEYLEVYPTPVRFEAEN